MTPNDQFDIVLRHRKDLRLLALLFASFVFIISCKDKDCKITTDQMPGFDTLTSIDGIQDVELSCVYLDSTMEDYYIIQTDSDYQNILGQFVSNENNCSGYSLPIIDFNNLTLLGKPAGGVCSTTFKRKVIKNQNIYTFIIKVTNSGGCAIPTGNDNWITIPKILNTDSVEFQVVYAYCDY